ncbi:MAG: DUF1553 domain-containing protein [Planctomycetaceae bacterium]|nr:DUF1553 domain-containing protein [Planctomycetaceae bacterium]
MRPLLISLTLWTGMLFLSTECQCGDDVDIQVTPTIVRLTSDLDRVQLMVTQRESSELSHDVTRQVTYESLAPEIASVSVTGRVSPYQAGETTIRVAAGESSVDVPVTVELSESQPIVSFTEDVIPVLTKAGCNQGACHGAQFGQGGLKFSLLGFAPEEDHPAIARDWSQRRLSFISPEESLLLRKATSAVPHGGGKRIDFDSPEYQILKAWIDAGAPGPVTGEPRLIDIAVTPRAGEYGGEASQQLRVTAEFDDGSKRDVTHLARYDSLGTGIATVDRDGYLSVVGQGQTAIMVRYRGRAIVSSIIRPFTEDVDLSTFEPANFVDEHVKAQWQKIGLQPSSLCSDETFIRRAFLASIGTLPTRERVERFLASDEPDKRIQLVDELLGLTGDPKRDVYVEAWSAYWTQKWGDLLRNNREQVGEIGMWAFANWIRSSLRENKPMDEFAREILLSRGSIYQNGQANYFKVAGDPTDLAETTAQVFLGLRLECAKCHQHPFESISQQDYYGLAAFFTQVSTKRSSAFGSFGDDTVVRLKTSGSIKHPRTGIVVPPTPLGQDPLEDIEARDLRRPLAEWLTSPENPLFARNIVNRTWGYLMGAPLVEPIDDLRETNPPSNPELLDALAADFIANQYDLRQLMRAIMASRTFALSSAATDENADDSRFFSHYPSTRLPAEVLLDAIDDACGTQERFTGVPLGTRAIELPDPNFESYFLDTLGRPQRIVSCECERTAEPNLAQVLQLANGELVQRKLTDEAGRIAKLVESNVDDESGFRELYLVSVGRHPTAQELVNCYSILAAAGDRKQGLEDILWALINSREFHFNH